MQFSARVRSQVTNFKPYSPGRSIAEIKDLFQLQTIVKMASNENPLGASCLVQKTLKRHASHIYRYPRPGCPDLCQALASQLELPVECLFAGNGSDEIIDLLFRVLPEPGQHNVVLFDPCFSIYQSQACLFGIETRRVPLNQDFSFPWSKLLSRVDDNTAMAFVTNPDNPSGYSVSAKEIQGLSGSLPENCMLVLDEAYIDFADDIINTSALSTWTSLSNTVILRTFSKIYGLAGLRLGYGIMPPQLADYLQRVRLPFSVNFLAEQAGIAALQDQEYYLKTRQTILQGRDYLQHNLQKLGCRVYPSQANFLLFQPPKPADLVFDQLLRRGLILRSLHSYNLPDHLRVSIGKQEENRLLIEYLEDILA